MFTKNPIVRAVHQATSPRTMSYAEVRQMADAFGLMRQVHPDSLDPAFVHEAARTLAAAGMRVPSKKEVKRFQERTQGVI